jgi:hypothetical protein
MELIDLLFTGYRVNPRLFSNRFRIVWLMRSAPCLQDGDGQVGAVRRGEGRTKFPRMSWIEICRVVDAE